MRAVQLRATFSPLLPRFFLLYEPIKRLNKENHNIQQGLAAGQRVFEIIDRKPEIEDKPDAIELEKVEGVIEFKNVSFKYDEKMVLKNINLRIEKNEVIALVGESGVGKQHWLTSYQGSMTFQKAASKLTALTYGI